MNWKIEGLNEFSSLHAMFFFCFRKVQDFCIYNLGCPNTPGKGVRYCDTHVGLARTYISEEDCEVGKRSLSTDEDLVIGKMSLINDQVNVLDNISNLSIMWKYLKLFFEI